MARSRAAVASAVSAEDKMKFPRCSVESCHFPAILHLGGGTYCLRHASQKLGGNVTLTTHLDVVAAPTCKSTTTTSHSASGGSLITSHS